MKYLLLIMLFVGCTIPIDNAAEVVVEAINLCQEQGSELNTSIFMTDKNRVLYFEYACFNSFKGHFNGKVWKEGSYD